MRVTNKVENNSLPTGSDIKCPMNNHLQNLVLLAEPATKVNVRGEYSDQDCKTLSSRGYDVVCTYNDNEMMKVFSILVRKLIHKKKRYIFFNN